MSDLNDLMEMGEGDTFYATRVPSSATVFGGRSTFWLHIKVPVLYYRTFNPWKRIKILGSLA